MVTKARPGAGVSPVATQRPVNGINSHHPGFPGHASGSAPHSPAVQDEQTEAAVKKLASSAEPDAAAPDMQAPSQGQANPQQPPDPSGEAPSEDNAAKRQQEDELLARAQGVRGIRATLEFAGKGPWPEPQQPMSHWSFLLKEMRWLAADVYQERLWKGGMAQKLAHEAARFDKARLKPVKGRKEETGRKPRSKAAREREKADSRRDSASLTPTPSGEIPQGLGPLMEDFCYLSCEGQHEAADSLLKKAYQNSVIQQELRIREYGLQYERSLLEARERSARVRRQIAAELRAGAREGRDGRDATPLTDDFDDFVRKKKKRPRPLAEEDSLPMEVLPPSKRQARKQQLSVSRPESGGSEDGRRDIDAGVETSGRRERLVKRKIRARDYDDDDYEEPPRIRDPGRVRKAPMDRTRPGLRSSDRPKKNQKVSGQTRPRSLDPEAALAWDKDDDNLLLSIVHEFGANWRLVADIFAVALKLSGIHRNAEMCRNHFREMAMTVAQEGYDMSPISALEGLGMNKQKARDIIQKTLPVLENTIDKHQKTLLELGNLAREKRAKAYQQEKENSQALAEPHASVLGVQSEVVRNSNGRILTPQQIVEQNEAQQKVLQQQQLAQQHQQHLAQQQQQQAQQQAAAAAAAAAPVAPGMSGGVAVAGMSGGGAYSQAESTAASAQQLQNPGQQGQPNGGMGMARPQGMGMANGYAQPQTQAMPPPAVQAQPPRILQMQQIQQMQQILTTGKMPNGADLAPNMRNQLMQKLHAYRSQQQQAHAARGGPGMAGGQPRPMGVHQMPGQNPGQMAAQARGGMQAQQMQMAGQAPGMSQPQAGGHPAQLMGPGNGMPGGQAAYPGQLQGQRPQYTGPVQTAQYAGGMPGQQNPGQYLGQHPHMQAGAGQFANPMPGGQLPGAQYGAQGMPRQGLNQLSSQMQAQYAGVAGGQPAGAQMGGLAGIAGRPAGMGPGQPRMQGMGMQQAGGHMNPMQPGLQPNGHQPGATGHPQARPQMPGPQVGAAPQQGQH